MYGTLAWRTCQHRPAPEYRACARHYAGSSQPPRKASRSAHYQHAEGYASGSDLRTSTAVATPVGRSARGLRCPRCRARRLGLCQVCTPAQRNESGFAEARRLLDVPTARFVRTPICLCVALHVALCVSLCTCRSASERWGDTSGLKKRGGADLPRRRWPGRPRRLVSLGHPNPPHIGTPASIHTAFVPRATQALVSPS